jgi:DNA-binding transcriptional regulator YdaS (Cro superfamily)
VAPIVGVREGAARGSATMAIVGLPISGGSTTTTTTTSTTTSTTTTTTTTPDSTTTTTSPPAACTVDELTISPDPINRTSSGASQLSEALHIDFTTNGSISCGELEVELISSHNKPTTETANVAPVEDGSADYSWTYVGSSNIWKAGTGTVRILQGTTLLATDTFQVN